MISRRRACEGEEPLIGAVSGEGGTELKEMMRDPSHIAPHGSVQEPVGAAAAAVGGMPAARAVGRPYAYVGIPVDVVGGKVQPPSYDECRIKSSSGEARAARGSISLGVGRDLTGAEAAALSCAKKDNAAWVEKRGFVEAQARARVEAEARAIEVARLNAKRRDAEGLDMRPHPGNRLESAPAGSSTSSSSAGFYGGKAVAYEGGGIRPQQTKEQELEVEVPKGGGGEEERTADGASGNFISGGYQPAEYNTAQYECAEYKSVYDTPPK